MSISGILLVVGIVKSLESSKKIVSYIAYLCEDFSDFTIPTSNAIHLAISVVFDF